MKNCAFELVGNIFFTLDKCAGWLQMRARALAFYCYFFACPKYEPHDETTHAEVI